jgi:hypothetical protein
MAKNKIIILHLHFPSFFYYFTGNKMNHIVNKIFIFFALGLAEQLAENSISKTGNTAFFCNLPVGLSARVGRVGGGGGGFNS